MPRNECQILAICAHQPYIYVQINLPKRSIVYVEQGTETIVFILCNNGKIDIVYNIESRFKYSNKF